MNMFLLHMRFCLPLLICLCFLAPAQAQRVKTGPGSTTPFSLGVVDHISSRILGEERTLNIYLPEGYSSTDTAHYPVIYLLDGSADEDFIHVAGLVQFNTFPWVNAIPRCILVGIANVNRKRDFTFPSPSPSYQKLVPGSGQSARFIAFLYQELQPYINARYRTTPQRTLIGESLGGLLATEVLLRHPTLFDNYIIISPSLWWNDGSLLRETAAPIPAGAAPRKVYIGVGKEGLGPGDNPHVMEVDANLLAEKLRSDSSKAYTVIFDYLPDENHATIGHQAVFNAFRKLFRASSQP
jgi:hypothetical protein